MNTFKRYVAHQQGQTSLTVTAPPDQSAVNGSPVTVTGTSRDPTRDIPMTFYTYPQPVLKPQLEHV